jgi:ferritin-like metal-binding protein YciE
VTDAMIVGAAQKGEHLEMAWYGMLRNWCQQLGHTEAVSLLEQSLEDEKRADEALSRIAEAGVNQSAASVL